MLGFILLLAVANLGLGYATAVLAPRLGAPWPSLRALRWRKAAASAAPPDLQPQQADASGIDAPQLPPEAAPSSALEPQGEPAADPAAAVAYQVIQAGADESQGASRPDLGPCGDDVPAAFLAMLDEAQHLRPPIDAVSDVLRLPIGRYRYGLLQLDDALRAGQHIGSDQSLAQCCEALLQENAVWLQQQVEATLKLQQRSSLPDEIDLLATRLHEALLGQRAQIESTAASLSRMRRSQAVDVEELLDELAALLDTSHALRDRMHEAVLSILASEDRLEQIEQPLLVDALTGLLNRTGMEMLVRRWWREDTQRRRPVSMALLDIDRQASVNRSQGGRGGDGLLAAVGQLIDQTMRCRRGFDLAARFSGQQILLFLGDTTPHNATCAAERFRQAVAQCTFLRHGQPVELSLTAAVVGVMPEDDMHSLVRRLHRTLRRAKQAGRNATWLEDNGRHFPVPAMDYQLPVRTIEIDLESQSGAP